ncbi:MAG: hypothetical protein WBP86_11750 [Thiobacillaceae bacterium]
MSLAVKFTMAVIKLTTRSWRFSYILGYLGKLGPMEALPEAIVKMLERVGAGHFVGAYTALSALFIGMKQHKTQQSVLARNAVAG